MKYRLRTGGVRDSSFTTERAEMCQARSCRGSSRFSFKATAASAPCGIKTTTESPRSLRARRTDRGFARARASWDAALADKDDARGDTGARARGSRARVRERVSSDATPCRLAGRAE